MTARLVARLDAMPLAAARLEALGLPQLRDRLYLLSGGSLAACPAAVAGRGHRLELPAADPGRAAGIRQLAIFPGPFWLEAGEDVIRVLAGPVVLHLVDCSLLAPPRRARTGIAAVG